MDTNWFQVVLLVAHHFDYGFLFDKTIISFVFHASQFYLALISLHLVYCSSAHSSKAVLFLMDVSDF